MSRCYRPHRTIKYSLTMEALGTISLWHLQLNRCPFKLHSRHQCHRNRHRRHHQRSRLEKRHRHRLCRRRQAKTATVIRTFRISAYQGLGSLCPCIRTRESGARAIWYRVPVTTIATILIITIVTTTWLSCSHAIQPSPTNSPRIRKMVRFGWTICRLRANGVNDH